MELTRLGHVFRLRYFLEMQGGMIKNPGTIFLTRERQYFSVMNKVTSRFPTKYFIVLSQWSPLLFWRQGWIAGEQKEEQKKEKRKELRVWPVMAEWNLSDYFSQCKRAYKSNFPLSKMTLIMLSQADARLISKPFGSVLWEVQGMSHQQR